MFDAMRYLFSLLLFASAVGVAQPQPAWKPDKPVELIIGAAPGGANDRIGRSLQRVLQEERSLPAGISVINKPGGGQSIAFAYLNTHPNNPHYLALASSSWLTTVAAGLGSITHRDVSPIVKLLDEYQVYFVKTDSAIRDARDVVDGLKKNPASFSFGFSTAAGNPLHISIANIARLAGADPARLKAVVFNSGAETATQVAGGHLDVGVQSAGSAMPLAQAGKIRIIGVAGPQRLTGPLASIATMREQGVDVIAPVFYVIFGPKGLDGAQRAYWDQTLSAVMQSDLIKKDLEANSWTVDLIGHRELPAFLEKEYQNYRRVLTEMGMVKK